MSSCNTNGTNVVYQVYIDTAITAQNLVKLLRQCHNSSIIMMIKSQKFSILCWQFLKECGLVVSNAFPCCEAFNVLIKVIELLEYK